jgi:hypothetical protein
LKFKELVVTTSYPGKVVRSIAAFAVVGKAIVATANARNFFIIYAPQT